MWQALVTPLVGGVIDLLTREKETVAKKSGVAAEVVEGVAKSFQDVLQKDERLQQQMWAQIEGARQHSVATKVEIPLVQLLRGLVRPSITFMAMGWYVYARAAGVPLLEEDYAIIGGVLAFWFGFRPFEKRIK